jgi:hypothetical protein
VQHYPPQTPEIEQSTKHFITASPTIDNKNKRTLNEMNKYQELRKRYPKIVSKDQLYIICRIAKRTAKYLLDNGIIPCVDTGKKTRRYRIQLEDIITYLKERERSGYSRVPRGAVSSKKSNMSTGPRISFSQEIAGGNAEEVRRYFEYISADFPDVLSSYEVGEMAGLSRTTVMRHLKSGALKSILVDRQRRVPKPYMFDFIASPTFLNAASNTKEFQQIMEGFRIWKSKKM